MSVLAITCVRDEAPWLLDWIAHHAAHGFDHFLIASHDCTDGTDALLDALQETGLVTHLPFIPTGDKAVQWQALKHLSDHPLYTGAELAMFFDVDEYLVLKEGVTLRDLMAEDVDGVPLRWHLFGSSRHSAWQDAPVTERFTQAAPDGMPVPLAHLFKTLHRPAAFDGLGVHRPKGKARWAFASGVKTPDKFAQMTGIIHLLGVPHKTEKAWLNHYSVRSIEEFILKSARGLPNHTSKPIDATYWALRNFNTVEDRRIAPMLDASRAKRAELSPFDTFHEAGRAHHKAKFDSLIATKEIVDLYWALELIPTSHPPSPAQFDTHVKMLTALHRNAAEEKKNG